MKSNVLFVAAFAVALAACTPQPQPAAISDMSEDKVIVQQLPNTPMTDVIDKANEGCALHGRQSRAVSVRCIRIPGTLHALAGLCDYKMHLFACVQ